MKKYLPLLIWVSVISCKKDSTSQPNAFTGNYKGTVTLKEDSRTPRAGLQLMSILPSSNTHEIMIGGSVLFTCEARLDQNKLIIEKTKAAHGQGYDLVEYGTGNFTGTTLHIEFHQDKINDDNKVSGTKTWEGDLVRY